MSLKIGEVDARILEAEDLCVLIEACRAEGRALTDLEGAHGVEELAHPDRHDRERDERPAIHSAARSGWEARTGPLAAMRFALRGTS